ncbi:MAG: thioredoxin family protein [Ignavibacteriaceae bacterium]|nr:thioredoxin family protein [Ignavibacteriaceae bacterium]
MKTFFVMMVLCGAMMLQGQEMNKLIVDERTEKPMLIGLCNYEAFTDTNFGWWYESGYRDYEINESAIDDLNPDPEEITITVVLGTWCGDSRREFPHFAKLMDLIGFPRKNITIIAVNRSKVAEGDEVAALDIQFVPTFIVYRNGNEIGRIIESPALSLEEDLAAILKK